MLLRMKGKEERWERKEEVEEIKSSVSSEPPFSMIEPGGYARVHTHQKVYCRVRDVLLQRLQGVANKLKSMCYPLNTYINRSSDETFDWHCDVGIVTRATIDISALSRVNLGLEQCISVIA